MKANPISMIYFLDKLDRINFQLDRVARLNTTARSYIASRQSWNIYLTLVIF